MNFKHLLLKSFTCALIGSALSSAQAEPAPSTDPVADSFRRLLDHRPADIVPAVPSGIGADPLRVSISSVLWETQALSFHQPSRYAPLAARPQPGH